MKGEKINSEAWAMYWPLLNDLIWNSYIQFEKHKSHDMTKPTK